MQCFPLYHSIICPFSFFLAGLEKKINRIRKRFLWNAIDKSSNKYLLVSWGQVYRPKEVGGFGIMDLRTFNISLMAKRWWHLLIRNQGSFQKLQITKYGPQRGTQYGGTMNAYNTQTFQKGMLVFKYLVWHSLEYSLGNGQNIAFWYDKQCLQNSLKIMFSNIFQKSINKNAR